MTYEIVFTNRAVKDLKKLDGSIKKRIIDQLTFFRNDPISLSKKLTNPKLGTYRYKVGDYRVVFDVNN